MPMHMAQCVVGQISSLPQMLLAHRMSDCLQQIQEAHSLLPAAFDLLATPALELL